MTDEHLQLAIKAMQEAYRDGKEGKPFAPHPVEGINPWTRFEHAQGQVDGGHLKARTLPPNWADALSK